MSEEKVIATYEVAEITECELNSLQSVQLIKQVASLQGYLSANGKQKDYELVLRRLRRIVNAELNEEIGELVSKKITQK